MSLILDEKKGFFVFGQNLENLAIVPGAGTAAAHGTVVQNGELVVD